MKKKLPIDKSGQTIEEIKELLDELSLDNLEYVSEYCRDLISARETDLRKD